MLLGSDEILCAVGQRQCRYPDFGLLQTRVRRESTLRLLSFLKRHEYTNDTLLVLVLLWLYRFSVGVGVPT